MLDLQRRLPSSRIYRFDNGTAYAVHSVQQAIALCRQGQPLGAVQSVLQRLTYGNEGWPDLLMGFEGKALGIEVKTGKDKLRKAQESMKLAFSKMGWGYYVFTDQKDYNTQLDELCLFLSNRS